MKRNMVSAITTIVYAENCTYENLVSVINHYPAFISPIHDRDVYSKDGNGHKAGEVKKSHYHVCILSALSKRDRRAFHLCVGNANSDFPWQDILDLEQFEKYVYHGDDNSLEDDTKSLYKSSDVYFTESYSSAKDMYLKMISSEDRDFFKEAYEIVENNDIREISDLYYYLFNTNDIELRDYIFRHESKFKHFIDSRRYRFSDNIKDTLIQSTQVELSVDELISAKLQAYDNQVNDLTSTVMRLVETVSKQNKIIDRYHKFFGTDFDNVVD